MVCHCRYLLYETRNSANFRNQHLIQRTFSTRMSEWKHPHLTCLFNPWLYMVSNQQGCQMMIVIELSIYMLVPFQRHSFWEIQSVSRIITFFSLCGIQLSNNWRPYYKIIKARNAATGMSHNVTWITDCWSWWVEIGQEAIKLNLELEEHQRAISSFTPLISEDAELTPLPKDVRQSTLNIVWPVAQSVPQINPHLCWSIQFLRPLCLSEQVWGTTPRGISLQSSEQPWCPRSRRQPPLLPWNAFLFQTCAAD